MNYNQAVNFGLILTSIEESIIEPQKFSSLVKPFHKAFVACAQDELWDYAQMKSYGTDVVEYDFKPVSVVLHYSEDDNEYSVIISFDNGFNYSEKIKAEDTIPTMTDFVEKIDNAFFQCNKLKRSK